MPTQEDIYNELAKSMATEYANYIADEIKDAVVHDIEETADANPNEDDLCLAIERALLRETGGGRMKVIYELKERRDGDCSGNLVRTLVEGLERAMCRDEGCHPRSDYAVIVDCDTLLRLRMESGRAAMCLPIDAQMKLAGAEIWVMRKMDGFAVARILERGSVE